MSQHPTKQINRAASLIVRGEYDEAIASLTETLKKLKLALTGDAKIAVPMNTEAETANEDQDTSDNDSISPASVSSSMSSSSIPSSMDSDTGIEFNFLASPASSSFLETDATLSIFRRPILIEGDRLDKAPLDVETCEQLSYASIYNIALSYHLKSVQISREILKQHQLPYSHHLLALSKQEERKQKVYCRKALSLYEHSHRIFLKQTSTFRGDVPAVHSLALAGNLGQIHHALGDHGKAEQCMQYLLSTMMYVIDCGKDAPAVPAEQQSQHALITRDSTIMDGFFSMVKPLISRDEPAAAA